jgi:hypothetical protein
MAKGAKGGMKAKLMEKHAAEQRKKARKPTGGKRGGITFIERTLELY